MTRAKKRKLARLYEEALRALRRGQIQADDLYLQDCRMKLRKAVRYRPWGGYSQETL